jgi:hypothetical protein
MVEGFMGNTMRPAMRQEPNAHEPNPNVYQLHLPCAGSMTVSVWFRMYWNDPRLRWDAAKTGVHYLFANNAGVDQADVWFPDVTLWNAASDTAQATGLRRVRILPNGDIKWSRNAVFDVSCNFVGLEAFPYGRIGCELEMGVPRPSSLFFEGSYLWLGRVQEGHAFHNVATRPYTSPNSNPQARGSTPPTASI